MGGGAEGRLVGREAELEHVLRTATFGDGPRALVLEGEAGIGKTAVWAAGIEGAAARGITVRATRAAESEATFAFAALADLLRELPSAALDALPPPQRRGLGAALLMVESADADAELHRVSSATLAVLRTLSSERPLLVAVDDAQWLDEASSAVLRFALRRPLEGVRFLLTRRVEDAAVVDAEATRLQLGPLSLGALQRLLLSREVALSAAAVRRLHEASGGNPFYALELAEALRRSGPQALRLGELPVPETLTELLEDRVARLPVEGERAVLAVALLAEPTVATVVAAAGRAGVDAAEETRLVVRDGTRLRLAHPLIGTAVRARASAPERRRLHLALAELVATDEERARHLALGSQPPDEAIAAELERAAEHADARGAAAAAAELAREAFLYSAGPTARRRRLLDAARRHMRAGELAAGRALLEAELPSFPPGPERARARFLLLSLAGRNDLAAWEDAAAEAEGEVRAEILAELAFAAAAGTVERLDEASAWAREAVELAQDRSLLLVARHSEAWIAAMRGDAGPARVLAAAEVDGRVPLVSSPDRLLAVIAIWRGETREAARLLDSLDELARDRDEEWAAVAFLHHRAELEGRIGDRRRLAATAERLARTAASIPELGAESLPRVGAMIAALGGDVVEARAHAAQTPPEAWQRLEARRACGLAALFAGDPAGAAEELGAVEEHARAAGVRDPGVFPVEPGLVEALVALGRLDEAEAVLEALEDAARVQRHRWAAAVSARVRGLLLEARGEGAAAEAALREALRLHESLDLPLDEARARLALGALLRRCRRFREAREQLAAAAATFEELDVPPLAERARDELARIAGRRRASGLTPTEERVAALVAEGRTNREVAAALVVTTKVVERHLTRIYTKLGVRSRAELARLVGESGGISRLPSPPAAP